MSFVLDASATLPWAFEDETTDWSSGLLNRLAAGEEAYVPAYWSIEVANGLVSAARRGRITLDQIESFTTDLAALNIRMQPPQDPDKWSALAACAQLYRLTAYDAGYLQLAQSLGLPLASLDREIRVAAAAAGVPLL